MPQNFIANETIQPCRIVTLLTTTIGRVAVSASDTTQGWGISQAESRRSPYIDSTGAAANAGEPVGVFDDGEECALEINGTVTIRDRIVATTGGKGITTTTDKKEYVAIALQSGVAGDKIKVKVQRGQTSL